MIKNGHQEIRFGAILGFITVVISNVIGLLYSPYVLKSIGQAEYGLYSLVTSIIAYLTVLDLGLGNTIIRYVAQYRSANRVEDQENILGIFVILYSLLGVISLLLGAFLFFYIEDMFGVSMGVDEIYKMKVMILVLVFNVSITLPLSVYSSVVIAYERFVFQKFLNLLRIIVTPVLVVLLLFFGYRVIGLVVVTTIVNIALLLWNVYYCYSKLKIRIKIHCFDKILIREIWEYSFWVFVGMFASRLYWSSGQFLVGLLHGSTSVVIIALSVQLVNYYIALASVIAGLFLPKVTGMVVSTSSMEIFSELFIKVARWQYIILLLVFSGFLVFGREFINLWVGSEYEDVFLISLMFMGAITIPWTQVLGVNILQACNKHAFRSIVYVATAALSVIIGYFGVKLYGSMGFACILSGMIILNEVVVMGFYYNRTGLKMVFYIKESLSVIIPISIFTAISYYLNNVFFTDVTYFSLGIKIIVYSLMYSVLVYFFVFNTAEKKEFKKMLKLFAYEGKRVD